MTARAPRRPADPFADDARPAPVRRASPGKDGIPLGLVSDPDPVAQAAARRAVLWRVDRALMTRAEARTVLDVLGLLPQRAPESPQEPSPVSTPDPTGDRPAAGHTAPGMATPEEAA